MQADGRDEGNGSGGPTDLKLGTLLSYFGIVEEDDIRRGLVLSKHTGLPLGKCLVMLNVITTDLVRACIEAQSMIKDGLLDIELADEALGVVLRKSWTLTDALILLGVDAFANRETRLGELLLSSGHIDEEQLDLALRACDASGLPLGRVLVLLNRLSEPVLSMALELQRKVRQGNMDRDHAINLLSQEEKTVPSEEAGDEAAGQRVRLGELLTASALITEPEIESAVERAGKSNKMLGQVLIDIGWLSEELLTAALRLQEMVWNGTISLNRAVGVLRQMDLPGLNPEEELARAGLTTSNYQRDISFCDFLRLSGYLNKEMMKEMVHSVMTSADLATLVMQNVRKEGRPTKDYLKEAIKMSFKSTELVDIILRRVHPDDTALIESALVMHDLLRSGKLTLDQAVVNFALRRSGLELEEAQE